MQEKLTEKLKFIGQERLSPKNIQPTNNLFSAIYKNKNSNVNITNSSRRLPEKPHGSMNWLVAYVIR